MKQIRHTPELFIRKLKTAEQLIVQGKTVADSPPTTTGGSSTAP
jgi:hypothetical protein